MRLTMNRTSLVLLLAVLALPPAALAAHCRGSTLVGGGGDDALVGGSCDDVLVGNEGDNEVSGATGHDLFVFSTGYCSGLDWLDGWFQPTPPAPTSCPSPPVPFFPDFGTTYLTDFTETVDRIALDKATFTALASDVGPGFSDPTDFHLVDEDAAVATDPAVIVYSTESEILFYNENRAAPGLGQGGPFAELDDGELEPADFLVIHWTPAAPTSSTPPCTTPRCTVDAVLNGPCVGTALPRTVTTKLERALTLIERAAAADAPGTARRLRRTAGRLLRRAGRAAGKAARGTQPKLSPACAEAIRHAAEGIRSDLAG